VLRKARRL